MNNTAYGTFTNGPGRPAASIKDIQDTLDKLRGTPPANWLLVSPDGRMWADPDLQKILFVALSEVKL